MSGVGIFTDSTCSNFKSFTIKMYLIKEVLFCVFLYLGYAESAALPPGITKCDLNNPDYNTCLAKAIQQGIIYFKNGYEKFGIPSVEPLTVESLVIGAGTGAVNVEQNFKNVKIEHGSEGETVEASYDPKTNVLKAKMLFKSIVLDGDYVMDGRILVLPIKGNGDFKITMHGLELGHELQFKDIEKNGKVFVEIIGYKVTLNPKKIDFFFNNLFDGNKELSDTLLTTLNDNWKEVFEDVKTGYEDAFAKIFMNYAQRFFRKVPKELIFS